MRRSVTIFAFFFATALCLAAPVAAQDPAAQGNQNQGVPGDGGALGGGGLPLQPGHFFTIIGYEVVPAPDNFFYSHAFEQFHAEPFSRTGALFTSTGPTPGYQVPQNQLWGDIFYIDTVQGFGADGNPVHVEADPNAPGQTTGQHTFYGRYLPPNTEGATSYTFDPTVPGGWLINLGDPPANRYASEWDTIVPAPPFSVGDPIAPWNQNGLPFPPDLQIPIDLTILPGLIPADTLLDHISRIDLDRLARAWTTAGDFDLTQGGEQPWNVMIGGYYLPPGEGNLYFGVDPIQVPVRCDDAPCDQFHTAVDLPAESLSTAEAEARAEQIEKRAKEAANEPALRHFMRDFGNPEAVAALNATKSAPNQAVRAGWSFAGVRFFRPSPLPRPHRIIDRSWN